MDCEASVWVLSGAITVLLRLAQFSHLSPLGIHCMCQKTQPERKPRGGVWSPYRHWPLLIYRSRELSHPSHIPIEKFLSYIQEKRARGQLCPHCCLCLARGRWSPISRFLSSRIQGNRAHVCTVAMAPLDCLAFGESVSNLRPLVFKKCSIIYLGAGEEATAEH